MRERLLPVRDFASGVAGCLLAAIGFVIAVIVVVWLAYVIFNVWWVSPTMFWR